MHISMKFCHLPGVPLVALRPALWNMTMKMVASSSEKNTESRFSTQNPVAFSTIFHVRRSNCR